LRNAKYEKYLLGDKWSCSAPLPRNSGKSLQQNRQISQVVHMMKNAKTTNGTRQKIIITICEYDKLFETNILKISNTIETDEVIESW